MPLAVCMLSSCCCNARTRCGLTSVHVNVGRQPKSRDVLGESCAILGGGVGMWRDRGSFLHVSL
jgi:hypothetical protein